MINFQQIKESARKSYNVCGEIITQELYEPFPEICQGCGRIIKPQERIEVISEEYIICEDCCDSLINQIEEGF